ncbi:geranylgeranylglycerol-phosphate geranylgeranyltransferase [Adhaeribacter aquaticus]|uniref:geranylgeranylglycerol-phosphate geranylgeranyltransferase n=1 Tax=Adhaeribacter aquaticus TaxID=299567 RepID=UPI0003F9FFC7|nr:geranylgeranylglycerol-phosphate geranylgeranyltransferase [Adhaeribacter aquaticus]
MKKVFNLIRFPNLLLIAFCQLLVQACLLQPDIIIWRIILNDRFYLLLLSTFCVAAAGYIINDYYDIKIDAINKPKRLVVGKTINRRQAMLAHLILSGIGIVVGLAINWKVGFINFFATMLLWGYSARLKKYFLVGNLTIALLSALMLLVVAANFNSINKSIWAYAIFAFLISLIREIIKDMEDVKGDASFDCRTLPIVLGIAKTKWVIYPLMLAFFATVIMAILYRLVDLFFTLHMVILVLLPGMGLLYFLVKADRKKDFSFLSRYCKAIMLMGILSMLLFR